uniref:Protein phosphatase 1 regulatory subunit 15A n=1 Tax=Electrophorus electricus TaxID=8005 RepID=A0A4W4GKR5_ELEEL
MALLTIDLSHPLYSWCLPQLALYIPTIETPVLSPNTLKTKEHSQLSPYSRVYILTMFQKIRSHLWEMVWKVLHHCTGFTAFNVSRLNTSMFLTYAKETMAMTLESKKRALGLEAQEWPGQAARSRETTRDTMKSLDEDEAEEEEHPSEEEEEPERSKEEDSNWSDAEDDSEMSTESTELWECFLNTSDPYNPLYFSSSTGVKANTVDARKRCPVSRPTASKAEKQTSTDREEPSPERNTKEGTKKVHFSEEVTVHHLVAWAFASRAARDGSCWLQLARDRDRFRRRVEKTGAGVSPCLTAEHRAMVWERLERGF